jgi:hypothetical protein
LSQDPFDQFFETPESAVPPPIATPQVIDPFDQFFKEEKEEERGALGEILAALTRGGTESAEGALRVLRALPVGGEETLSRGIEYLDNLPKKWGVEPTKKGEFWRSVNEGVEAAVQSLAAGLTGAAIIASLPVSVPAAVGFAVGAGGLFTLREYDEFMEEAKEYGLKPEDVRQEAVISALAEGGFEAVSDYVGLRVFGFIGKGLMSEGAKKGLLRALGRFAGRLSVMGSVEVPSEMATSAVQANQRSQAGMKSPDEWEAAKQAIGPTAVMTLLLGGLGQAASTIRTAETGEADRPATEEAPPLEEEMITEEEALGEVVPEEEVTPVPEEVPVEEEPEVEPLSEGEEQVASILEGAKFDEVNQSNIFNNYLVPDIEELLDQAEVPYKKKANKAEKAKALADWYNERIPEDRGGEPAYEDQVARDITERPLTDEEVADIDKKFPRTAPEKREELLRRKLNLLPRLLRKIKRHKKRL